MSDLEYRLTLKDLFSKKIDTATASVSKLDGGMSKLSSKMSGMGGMIAGAFSIAAVVGFGKAVIDSLSNYESFSASLRVLMFGDRQAAKALEGQLVTLASKTPFSLVDVQQGTKQLMAYGFQAGTIVTNMKMLGDISSGVGKPLGDIVYLYGTLKTQGRAFSKDINQFTTAGINLLPKLAKQFKVADSEVMKLVEDGKVGFKDVEKAFQSMTSAGGQFFGMMDEQSKTTGGQISNLGDSWEQLKVHIGQSQTGIIAGTVGFLKDLISKVDATVETLNTMENAYAKYGAKDFSGIKKVFSQIGSAFGIQGDVKKQEDLAASLQSMYVKPSALSSEENIKSMQGLMKLKANFERAHREDIAKNQDMERRTINNPSAYSKAGLKVLANERKNLNENFGRDMALISDAQEKINGNMKVLKAVAPPILTETKDLKKEKAAAKIGSPTEYNGARPQNITINLDRLGDVSINAATVTEGANESREIFSKYLLEVLNDANLMARR
jgi:phage tail tape-measure protein